MTSVYEELPVLENTRWLLKKTDMADAEDLFEVYSDKDAVPFFNSDNCNGDTFYYNTFEKMEKAIEFWDYSYRNKWFVRWSIVDKANKKAIGTIELFHRDSTDYFNNTGLLRLDLKSNYETEDIILDILNVIIPDTYAMFDCNTIATKAITAAAQRIKALEKMGFKATHNCLVGHDGTEYGSYYVR